MACRSGVSVLPQTKDFVVVSRGTPVDCVVCGGSTFDKRVLVQLVQWNVQIDETALDIKVTALLAKAEAATF